MNACAFSPSGIARLLALIGAMGAAAALAAPFELAVAPSRFELAGKPGARIGQSLDVHNLASAATEISVRTLDWSYSQEGEITYHDELLPGSCRPWVMLERRSVSVAARSKRSFRFQIDPPADAPRGECRFMIALEGVEPAQQTFMRSGATSLSLPVTGRIAIAVYLMLAGAEPRLEIRQISMAGDPPARRPVLIVRNSGDAHGRLEGSLDATDSQGRAFELIPEATPILPGQTRSLALVPKAQDGEPVLQPLYPVQADGTLDWDKGSFKVNVRLQ